MRRREKLDKHIPIYYVVNYKVKAYHPGMSAHSTSGWTKHKISYSNNVIDVTVLPYFPKF